MSVEAVPRYSLETALDDRKRETVQLRVSLPGMMESSEIAFTIENPRLLRVHVPGRYRTDIPLSVAVEGKAEVVQFLRKRALLRATLLVAQEQQPHAQQQQRQQQEQQPQQVAQPAATPAPKEGQPPGGRGSGSSSSSTPAAVQAPAGPAERGAAPHSQQQQQQQRAEPADGAATSPREQLDAELYAAAKQQANREAAEDCHLRAQRVQRIGDPHRAVRLLQKACQLDPGNPMYATALQEAQAAADKADAAASSSSGAAGSSAGAGQRADGAAGPQGSSGASGGSQQQQNRRQQQQKQHQHQHQHQHAPEEEHTHAAAGSSSAPGRLRRQLGQWLGVIAAGLFTTCIMLAALYGAWRLAPPAAAPAEEPSLLHRLQAGALFLPRVLFWQPTWPVAVLSAVAGVAACAALSAVDHAQQLLGRRAAIPPDVYIIGLMGAWHPVLWRCCGGGWGSVLGTLGQLLPITGLLGVSSAWGHLLAYPAACFVLCLAAPWLEPVWRVAAAPPLWLLRYAIWTPAWWLCGPLAAACFMAVIAGRPPLGLPAGLWMQAMMTVAAWWLSGGGWWAVVHTAAVVGGWSTVVFTSLRFPQIAGFLGFHTPFAAAPLFIAKLAWDLLWWSTGMRTLVAGVLGAAMLWWHLTRDPPPSAGGGDGGAWHGQQRAGLGSGGSARHLRNEVPAGAPEAVVRILQAANFYEVLGVGQDAEEAAIKRAKRTLSLATHPDKIGDAPGANEAFNLVTEACEVLGDAAKRREYDTELASAASFGPGFTLSPEDMEGIPPEWVDRMAEFVEAVERGDIPQQCEHCNSIHFLRRTDRPMHAARRCDECGTCHPVRQNEVWFESASAGFMRRTILMFCCYKGVVYDMSEQAACEGTLHLIHERRLPLNRHNNFFRSFGLSTGGGGGGGGGGSGRRGRQAQAPPRQQGPRGSGGKKKKGRR